MEREIVGMFWGEGNEIYIMKAQGNIVRRKHGTWEKADHKNKHV